MMKNKNLALVAAVALTACQQTVCITSDVFELINDTAAPIGIGFIANKLIQNIQDTCSKYTDATLNRIKPHRLEGIRLYSDKALFSLTDEEIGKLLAGDREFMECLPKEQQAKICSLLDKDGKLSPLNTKLGLNQLVPQFTEKELITIMKQRRANAQKRAPAFASAEWFMRKVGHKGFQNSARLTCLGSKVKIKTKDGHDFDIPYFDPTCPLAKGSDFMNETMPYIKGTVKQLPLLIAAGAYIRGRSTPVIAKPAPLTTADINAIANAVKAKLEAPKAEAKA